MVISLQQSPSELSLLQASGESPSPENQQTHDAGQWMEGCEHLQVPQSEVVCLCSDGKFGTERDEIHYCSILSRLSQCDGLLLCWMHQGSIICYPDSWGCQCWMVRLTAVSIMSSSGTSTLYVYAGANLWTEDIKFWKEDPANCRVIVLCWSSLCPCMTAKHRWERNSGSMSQWSSHMNLKLTKIYFISSLNVCYKFFCISVALRSDKVPLLALRNSSVAQALGKLSQTFSSYRLHWWFSI